MNEEDNGPMEDAVAQEKRVQKCKNTTAWMEKDENVPGRRLNDVVD